MMWQECNKTGLPATYLNNRELNLSAPGKK